MVRAHSHSSSEELRLYGHRGVEHRVDDQFARGCQGASVDQVIGSNGSHGSAVFYRVPVKGDNAGFSELVIARANRREGRS